MVLHSLNPHTEAMLKKRTQDCGCMSNSSYAIKILILSPDTDTYHIGLPLDHGGNKDIILQISPNNSKDLRFLHLSAFITVLKNDPDLSTVPQSQIPQVIQTLFVVTGCDYVSFFSGIGKAAFMKYFYQHADFICSEGEQTLGTLAHTGPDLMELNTGFLSFIRLVGTAYFKKYAHAFAASSPKTHFMQLYDSSITPLQHHTVWLDHLRQSIWDRIQFENETIPSTDALYRHWKRACWVMDMWHQSNKNEMELAPLADFGWIVDVDLLSIDWDSRENMQAIHQRVASLLRGCKCKTGCSTSHCGCRVKGKQCSEGCECINCVNIKTSSDPLNHLVLEEQVMGTEMDLLNEEVDEIMDWVFGEEQSFS